MREVSFAVPQGDFVENPENMISLKHLQNKSKEKEGEGREGVRLRQIEGMDKRGRKKTNERR